MPDGTVTARSHKDHHGGIISTFKQAWPLLLLYVTRSRKRGPFPQKSDCELDLSADSAKSIVYARENRLTLAHSVPKLQSFEYHKRAFLGFEIGVYFSPVGKHK